MSVLSDIIRFGKYLIGNPKLKVKTENSPDGKSLISSIITEPRIVNDLAGGIKNQISNITGSDGSSDTPVTVVTPASSGSSYARRSSGSSKPIYIDAPMAQQYKMSRSTAYQEALANTSHQREMQDLIAAGLNPVLTANGGSGASVFSGEVYTPSLPGSTGSGRSVADKDNKNLWSGVSSVVGGAVTAVTGKPAYGQAAKNIVDGLGKIFS